MSGGAGELLGLALLGGLLNLDRTALLQSMVSRPLVAASLAGWWLGCPGTGLLCGALLELVWLAEIPVGAAIPPDDTLVATLAVVCACACPDAWPTAPRAALGIGLAVPFGALGRSLDGAVRRWNGRLFEGVCAAVARDEVPCLGAAQWLGVARFFGAGAVLTAAGSLLAGRLAAALAAALPPAGVRALELAAALLPVVGLAAALGGLRVRGRAWLFGAGVAAGALASRIPTPPRGGRL